MILPCSVIAGHALLSCRFLKNLQIIVSTVLQSIPAMGSILILISLVLCILQLIIGAHILQKNDVDFYQGCATDIVVQTSVSGFDITMWL